MCRQGPWPHVSAGCHQSQLPPGTQHTANAVLQPPSCHMAVLASAWSNGLSIAFQLLPRSGAFVQRVKTLVWCWPQAVDLNSDERISFTEWDKAFRAGGVQQIQVGTVTKVPHASAHSPAAGRHASNLTHLALSHCVCVFAWGSEACGLTRTNTAPAPAATTLRRCGVLQGTPRSSRP